MGTFSSSSDRGAKSYAADTEGVNKGEPLSVVLYEITIVPLREVLRASDLGILTIFSADDAEFYGLAWRSAHILKLLMDRGPYRGSFPDPYKPIFIADLPDQEEAKKREFTVEGLDLNFVGGSWYLGAYLGPW